MRDRLSNHLFHPSAHALVRLSYVVLGVWFVVLRLAGIVNGPQLLPDAHSYAEVADRPLLSPGFYADMRGLTTPLLWKLVGNTPPANVLAQWVLATVCWAALAIVVARATRTLLLKPIAAFVVLALGLTPGVLDLDAAMQAESPTFSLSILLIAGFLWLLERWSWGKALSLIVLLFFWANVRDSNAFLMLLMVGMIGVVALLRKGQRRYLVFVTAALFIFVQYNSRAVLWRYALVDVIYTRVLPDEQRLDEFQQLGMPVNDALMQQQGKSAFADMTAFETQPELDDFEEWINTHGKTAYMRWLLTHPVHFLTAPATEDFDKLFRPYTAFGAWHDFDSPLPMWLERVFCPTDSLRIRNWGGAVLLVTIIVGTTIRPRWLRGSPQLALVSVFVLLLAWPHAMICWHGDSFAVHRHLALFALQFRLGFWLLLLASADQLAVASFAATGPRAAKSSTSDEDAEESRHVPLLQSLREGAPSATASTEPARQRRSGWHTVGHLALGIVMVAIALSELIIPTTAALPAVPTPAGVTEVVNHYEFEPERIVKVHPDGGFIFRIQQPGVVRNESGFVFGGVDRSQWWVTEDGVPLPYPHATKDEIIEQGGGRFNHLVHDFMFSATDNSDPRTNGRRYAATKLPAVWLDPQTIRSRAGYAYTARLPLPAELADGAGAPQRSDWILLENGRPLGAGHVRHKEIEDLGLGRFSHWDKQVVFSASDNTDPRSNGRSYILMRVPRALRWR